jgi:hypothetical protein
MHPMLAALLLALVILGGTCRAEATERPDHYEGEESASFAEAIERLADANRRLRELTDGRTPTAVELHELHVASYTMERALERLRGDLEPSAAALERLHLASERGDAKAVSAAATDYLAGERPDR